MSNRKVERISPTGPVQPIPPRPEVVLPISKRDKKSFQESLDKAIENKLKSKIDRKA